MPVLAVALLFSFFLPQVKLSDETGIIARGEAVWDDGEAVPIDSGVGVGRLAVTSSDSAPGPARPDRTNDKSVRRTRYSRNVRRTLSSTDPVVRTSAYAHRPRGRLHRAQQG